VHSNPICALRVANLKSEPRIANVRSRIVNMILGKIEITLP